jgi:hypothetical protein
VLQALAISPVCPEAYNVLALASADTYEEALDFYKKAVELGPQVIVGGVGGRGGPHILSIFASAEYNAAADRRFRSAAWCV